MYCHILKNKHNDEEYLIPGCYGVALHWHLQNTTDRDIIKEFCSCDRERKEKYQTKTRDEVFIILTKIKERIWKIENELAQAKEDLGGMESEIFMLNSEEVDIDDVLNEGKKKPE